MIRVCAGVVGGEEAEAEADEAWAIKEVEVQSPKAQQQQQPRSMIKKLLLIPNGLKLRGVRTVTRKQAGHTDDCAQVELFIDFKFV